MSKTNLWMYASPEEMRSNAGSLIVFGAEVFHRAKIISQLEKLKYIKRKLDEHTMSGSPPPEIMEFSFEYLVDCIRILIFFENYMKAELVARGFVIHLVNKQFSGFEKLAKEQMERPILIKEVVNIQTFQIDKANKIITHPALKNNTLSFQVLIGTKPYLDIYNFPECILDTIKEMTVYRNQLHLHHGVEFRLTDGFLENLQSMKDFVANTMKKIH